MEEKIKDIARSLKICFAVLWILPIIVIILGEFAILPIGCLATDYNAQYIWNTVAILITLSFVPFSLKLFNFVLTKKIDEAGLVKAMKLYVRWSFVRYILMIIVIILGMITYYLTMSNIGYLCAAIGLVASLFCIPSEKRVKEELHL